jgi:CelD/BcsL family acetyltransferase involved in cellulose biosynthesis
MRSAQSLPDLASNLEIAVHRGDLDALAVTWESLVDPSHPGAAFRSWAWTSAWWKSFSVGKEPFVLVAREAGETVGLLPLCAERSPLGGRRLIFMGEGIVGSDYLGVVCRAGDEERLASAFAEHLAHESYDELSLDGIRRGDPLLPALEGVLPASRADVELRYKCPHITLVDDFESYIAKLPDGTGPQWKRRLRWLEKRPGFEIETLTDPNAIVVGLDALFELHHKRWSVEGGSDAIDGPEIEAFHRLAARGLADIGWARLYLLQVEGAPRAALYGWKHGDRFAFYQAGYDPEWRQRSVGTVLLGHIVRECYAGGLKEYDFLRGSEPYKLKWANGWRETVRLRARDASLRALLHDAGRTAYWRLREAGKRALPESALDWARRARKKATR